MHVQGKEARAIFSITEIGGAQAANMTHIEGHDHGVVIGVEVWHQMLLLLC